jgi:hypothetical protein
MIEPGTVAPRSGADRPDRRMIEPGAVSVVQSACASV